MKYTIDIDDNIYDDNKKMPIDEVVYTLNYLHKQNKQLKEEIKQLVQGMQEDAKISAEAFTKALFKKENTDLTWQTKRYQKP